MANKGTPEESAEKKQPSVAGGIAKDAAGSAARRRINAAKRRPAMRAAAGGTASGTQAASSTAAGGAAAGAAGSGAAQAGAAKAGVQASGQAAARQGVAAAAGGAAEAGGNALGGAAASAGGSLGAASGGVGAAVGEVGNLARAVKTRDGVGVLDATVRATAVGASSVFLTPAAGAGVSAALSTKAGRKVSRLVAWLISLAIAVPVLVFGAFLLVPVLAVSLILVSAGSAPAEVDPVGGGSSQVGSQGWAAPAPGWISSGFGPRPTRPVAGVGSFHYGTDIVAACGQVAYAAAGGTVSYAAPLGSYGNWVLIDHGAGVQTGYAHNSQILVKVGERVTAGSPIALVGSTGASSGCHLHFEVRVFGVRIDPRAFMSERGSRIG